MPSGASSRSERVTPPRSGRGRGRGSPKPARGMTAGFALDELSSLQQGPPANVANVRRQTNLWRGRASEGRGREFLVAPRHSTGAVHDPPHRPRRCWRAAAERRGLGRASARRASAARGQCPPGAGAGPQCQDDAGEGPRARRPRGERGHGNGAALRGGHAQRVECGLRRHPHRRLGAHHPRQQQHPGGQARDSGGAPAVRLADRGHVDVAHLVRARSGGKRTGRAQPDGHAQQAALHGRGPADHRAHHHGRRWADHHLHDAPDLGHRLRLRAAASPASAFTRQRRQAASSAARSVPRGRRACRWCGREEARHAWRSPAAPRAKWSGRSGKGALPGHPVTAYSFS
jgi:hypothetical protein